MIHVRISPPMGVRVKISSRAPLSFRGHHCRDCGAPISPYSRGRCRACGYLGLKRSIPEDFLIMLRQLGSHGAARHYHASLGTITRWRRELDLRPQARIKKGIGQQRSSRGFVERPLLTVRDLTLPGQAADFLRRYGSVYRCDVTGKPNSKGTHWRRNISILDDDTLMRHAARLGWTPSDF